MNDMALEFIRDLFAGCVGYIEITLLDDSRKDSHDRRSPRTRWVAIEQLHEKLPETLALADKAPDFGYGVYIGAGARIKTLRKGKRAKKEHVGELPAFWIDIDWGYERIAEATMRLQTFTLPPTKIVATGGGVQAWWLLKTPYQLKGDARETAEAIMKGLARTLEGDTAVADVARIMRLPGYPNMKPARNRFMATTLQDDGPLYDATQFAAYIAMAQPVNRYSARTTYKPANGKRRPMTHAANNFLINGAPVGSRHTYLMHTAYQMREKGYSREDCEALAGSKAAEIGLPEREIAGVINYVYR